MFVLGIETSCDETAAAVVDHLGQIYSNIIYSQSHLHAENGGIVPELASRDHLRHVDEVTQQALDDAGCTLSDLDVISVTSRPGLIGSLLVGVQFAKGLSWAAKKPLMPVDHLFGHLLSCFLTTRGEKREVPSFPFVALLVSGGHTALYRVDSPHPAHIKELGATRDDAAGEAYDKVAKMLGLTYPGGPVIDKLAHQAEKRDDEEMKLARQKVQAFSLPMLKGLEFSFSGIKTQMAARLKQDGPPKSALELLAYAEKFQYAVTTVLAQKLFAAAKQEGIQNVVLGGGVAANGGLRQKVLAEAKQRGMAAYLPTSVSCTDNAAMIAYAGVKLAEMGERAHLDFLANNQSLLQKFTKKGRGKR